MERLKINSLDRILNLVELDPIGFILISANKNFIPVLGYSFEHNLNMKDLPIQLKEVMKSYRKNIIFGIHNNIIPSNKISNLWMKYTNEPEMNRELREVSPLTTANWNQGGDWNNMCPGNSLVGCVAVAMGQVMYYWGHPTQGNGYSAYYHGEYGPISVNFEDYTYEFYNMWPTVLGDVLLDTTGGEEIETTTATFAYSHFERTTP